MRSLSLSLSSSPWSLPMMNYRCCGWWSRRWCFRYWCCCRGSSAFCNYCGCAARSWSALEDNFVQNLSQLCFWCCDEIVVVAVGVVVVVVDVGVVIVVLNVAVVVAVAVVVNVGVVVECCDTALP
jgi:hypothetical protein